jgi:fructan beta-fructosidase
MAVYDESDGRRSIVFHSSTDLKSWTEESRIDGFYECPDLFELPVEGEPGRTLWGLSAADGRYLLGQFDGKAFRPDGSGMHQTWFGDFYAAQTFSDEPKGRRVQVAWARGIDFPGRPFNQQMTLPTELTLHATPEGARLVARPVAEFDALRADKRLAWNEGDPTGGGGDGEITLGPVGDLLDIRAEGRVGPSGRLDLALPGVSIAYDASRKSLECNGATAPLDPAGGLVRLRVVLDLGSVEVFGDDGRVAISKGLRRREGSDRSLTARVRGEGTRFRSVEVKILGPSRGDLGAQPGFPGDRRD